MNAALAATTVVSMSNTMSDRPKPSFAPSSVGGPSAVDDDELAALLLELLW